MVSYKGFFTFAFVKTVPMSEAKTRPNPASVKDFIKALNHPAKEADSFRLLEIFEEEIGEPPVMWGGSIIGFGKYKYVYESGRSGDWMLSGFSPRKTKFSLYLMAGFSKFDEILQRLGKHKTGKGCLYVNKLADVDEEVLRELIRASVAETKKRYAAYN